MLRVGVGRTPGVAETEAGTGGGLGAVSQAPGARRQAPEPFIGQTVEGEERERTSSASRRKFDTIGKIFVTAWGFVGMGSGF